LETLFGESPSALLDTLVASPALSHTFQTPAAAHFKSTITQDLA
jgi:hypothetical protein